MYSFFLGVYVCFCDDCRGVTDQAQLLAQLNHTSGITTFFINHALVCAVASRQCVGQEALIFISIGSLPLPKLVLIETWLVDHSLAYLTVEKTTFDYEYMTKTKMIGTYLAPSICTCFNMISETCIL